MNAKLTVYFDGACPVCRREIGAYQRQAGAADIVWIDAAACDPSSLGPGLDRRLALSRLHVRAADGTLAAGAAAFVAVWRELPKLSWLARLASSRPVLLLLDGAYSMFLRLRPLWRTGTSQT